MEQHTGQRKQEGCFYTFNKKLRGAFNDANTGRTQDWSDLPNDIVCLVAKKLTSMRDVVHMLIVCRSWNSALIVDKPSWHRWGPWHPWAFIVEEETRGSHSLYDPCNRTFYKIEWSEFRGKKICGCIEDWLVMFDYDLGIELINPFSLEEKNRHIQLPSLPLSLRGDERLSYLHKVAFSSSTPWKKTSWSGMVMAILAKHKLVFVKPEDEVVVIEDKYVYKDVIYHGDEFYSVSSDAVHVFDSQGKGKLRCVENIEDMYPGSRRSIGYNVRLVKSEKELYVARVRRSSRYKLTAGGTEVYRGIVNGEGALQVWRGVESLDDGSSFFLDCSSSLCVQARSVGCTPNCIYFIEARCEDGCDVCAIADVCVFSLEDRLLQRHKFVHLWANLKSFWLQPKLR